jgi:hypothetical protein
LRDLDVDGRAGHEENDQFRFLMVRHDSASGRQAPRPTIHDHAARGDRR